MSAMPVAHRTPLDAEPRSQPLAQRGLVEVSGRLGVLVDATAVERRPTCRRRPRRGWRRARACGAADRRRATCDAGTPRRSARAPRPSTPAALPPAARRDSLEVAERVGHGLVVRGANRSPQPLVADAEQDADALRRGERDVEARARAARAAARARDPVGPPAVEHGRSASPVDRAPSADRSLPAPIQ